MNTVVFDISMSLDGYMTASGQSTAEPMGEGGQVLHTWAFGEDEQNQRYMASATAELGAVIAGRRTYDHSLPWWGADGPTGPARRPVFVVTHEAPTDSPAGGVYTFVTDGINSALRRAKAVAGNGNVTVMGGASLGQQCITAGLIDEISIHLVPVLFGDGTRMFDNLKIGHRRLEPIETIPTPSATHLRFRVVKPDVADGKGTR
ncbi:MAG TPA: deaminase [Micromonosporaceae bacterium]|nr:deaminase [Micromonosporaceae bacterium]